MKIIENIRSHKSTLVIVKNDHEMTLLKSWMDNVLPSDMILQFDPTQTFTQQDITKLKSYYHLNYSPPPKDHRILNYQYQTLLSKVSTYFISMYSTKVTENNTWKEIADMYCLALKNEKVAILHAETDTSNFEMTEAELTALLQVISDAQFIYKREFELIDKQPANDMISVSDHPVDSIQYLTHELFLLRDDAEQLRDMYYTLYQQMEKDIISNSTERIRRLENDIDFLLFRMTQYANNKLTGSGRIYSLFGKENIGTDKMNILSDYSKIRIHFDEKKIPKSGIKMEYSAQISDELLKFKELLSIQKQTISREASEKIRSANKYNIADPSQIIRLESSLGLLVNRINKCGIFPEKLEINTLSFKKQTDFISRLAFDLDIALLRIEKNIAYYDWLAFLHHIDPKYRSLLQILKRFSPDEWTSLAEQWFRYEILQKAGIMAEEIDKQILRDLCMMESELKQSTTDHSISTLHHERSEVLKSLYSSEKELFASLMKNKKWGQVIPWKHVFCKNADFFSKMHAVTLLNNDDITEIKDNTYDVLIYLNPGKVNVEILQKFSRIITFYDEEYISLSEALTLHRYTNHLTKSFTELSMTERLPAARKLSEGLLQFGKIPVVYQLRHSFIMTFCAESINEIIEEQLYQFGIKQLLNDNETQQIIIGAMLDTDRSIYIITENQLINPEDSSNISSQIYLLDQVIKGGCKIINVDTIRWITMGDMYMPQLMDEVRKENLQQQPSKNQLKIEFS